VKPAGGGSRRTFASRKTRSVRLRNEELEEQCRSSQAESRAKVQALANLAHDLRTPLNAIIGFAELMHDAKVGPVSPSQKEFLGDILTSSRQILGLIDGLQDPPPEAERRAVE